MSGITVFARDIDLHGGDVITGWPNASRVGGTAHHDHGS